MSWGGRFSISMIHKDLQFFLEDEFVKDLWVIGSVKIKTEKMCPVGTLRYDLGS